MSIFLIILHVIVCVALIVIVLLQKGKGTGMGAAFGGSSNTLLGSGGAATLLGKVTTAIAVIFMITSLSLAYISKHKGKVSVIKETLPPIEKPVDKTN